MRKYRVEVDATLAARTRRRVEGATGLGAAGALFSSRFRCQNVIDELVSNFG